MKNAGLTWCFRNTFLIYIISSVIDIAIISQALCFLEYFSSPVRMSWHLFEFGIYSLVFKKMWAVVRSNFTFQTERFLAVELCIVGASECDRKWRCLRKIRLEDVGLEGTAKIQKMLVSSKQYWTDLLEIQGQELVTVKWGGGGHKCLSKMSCKEDMHAISSETRLINISARTSSIFVQVQMNILNTDQI